MWAILQQIFPYAVAYTIPLLMTALGALYCERSGVINIGLDGFMIVGSFAGALTISKLQESMGAGSTTAIWIGLVVSIIVGMLFSLLHAFASINLNADQTISGTAINMMAGAVTIFLARTITGSGRIRITNGFYPMDIPGLSQIPIIGDLLFKKTYITTWVSLGILFLSAFLIYKTRFGLRLRSCGEHPQASDAAGINVYKMRYIGVLLSGGLSSFAGAVMLVTFSGEFNGSVSGLGFLALAALIFGQWKPLGILAATAFFGFATTIANVSQVIPALGSIPLVILKVFPYAATLLALVVFSKSSRAPKAEGEPFDKGKR
ncbi:MULTISPECIES: ABC transporter permease [Clostridium]|jgi:simple sugar transport system permease protein|uniref:Nucleoside ABC transporter membrane protein n=3 Tax=Clostridium TaxID=1485 RepID=M1MGE2_9CLOT|nr:MULTISPECIES: ABC transporter permease [Clostridium]MDF2674926.1 sugar transporter, permease protein [Clostridiales bacterium]AGF55418.1 sugar ABC transporter, permease protein [Clostridium saccharoperbutylacetonicum N1-4(HMT)]AGF58428.1 nucleoside ABC transporter membrane protein [Clostridium saccharoperbutylacetonicum N1-4(HMT)]AQR94317.1 branched-chain amino acid transport system / permease component [Clostridium saccharoperbutylacetonicum]AQR97121.1 branched-chain amino acid transport s